MPPERIPIATLPRSAPGPLLKTVHVSSYLVPRRLEALAREQIIHILREPRELPRSHRLPDLRALARLPRANVVHERQPPAREERRDRDVRHRVLPDREAALRGEERLDVLERGVQVRGGRAPHLQPKVRGGELARHALDEEARLGARDRVRGDDAGGGEEVADELDEHERLGDLCGLGRGLVGGDGRAAVRDGGNLV